MSSLRLRVRSFHRDSLVGNALQLCDDSVGDAWLRPRHTDPTTGRRTDPGLWNITGAPSSRASARFEGNGRPLFFDAELEADEMYQNAGEKGDLHPHPSDPPRRRANKRRGRGTMANDRPPILGLWGRSAGQVRFFVIDNTTQATIVPLVVAHTHAWSTLYTDECNAYYPISATGRFHATVCHSRREWARDDDGDGIREVHSNSMEGIWTGLRNFLRPFRSVHKRYLAQYVAIFE